MSGLIGTSHSKSKVIGRSQDTAKAWVRFNGQGTPAKGESFNVSTITDQSDGTNRITFLRVMSSADYSAFSATNDWNYYSTVDTFTTTYFQITTTSADTNSRADTTKVHGLVFGD